MVMKLDHDDLNRLIEKISSSDIQEFSLEGEDFKLEIKRNLFNNNQSPNNYLATQNSLEKQQLPHLWLAPFIGLQLLVRSLSLT